MEKVVFDINVFDVLIEDHEFNQVYNQAKDLGLINLLTTRVHLDQANQIKDITKRDMILRVINSTGTTITYGEIPVLSRPGWSTPAPSGTLEKILGDQAANDGNMYDALLASTSFHEADIFVTNDIRLRNRCQNLKKRVMTIQEFKSYLRNLLLKKT